MARRPRSALTTKLDLILDCSNTLGGQASLPTQRKNREYLKGNSKPITVGCKFQPRTN
jgi:hypothetical protein